MVFYPIQIIPLYNYTMNIEIVYNLWCVGEYMARVPSTTLKGAYESERVLSSHGYWHCVEQYGFPSQQVGYYLVVLIV